MSNIYIQEPPTFGKVLLVTTVGDIDIELWAKETPKACRNFVQLGMEGYYNGTTFHRVVKGFIAQGGDPTGTGTGGESIYGEPFKDEFHTRLRFCRRGLVAMANSGKDDNGSQFFFTFAACPELQNKHTIFGKVAGDTIYNMLKLEDAETDENEAPLYPEKIIRMEILNNPFPDIVPRCLPPKKSKEKKKKTEKGKAGVKNFKLLSFGEEAEEDEEENKEINLTLAGRSKSTHDVLNDPKLSSVPALEKKDDDDLSGDEDFEDKEKAKLKLEDVKKKLKRNRSKSPEKKKIVTENQGNDDEEEFDFGKEEAEKKKQRLEEIAKEIEALKKDYQKNKKEENKKGKEESKESQKKQEKKEIEDNEIMAEYKQNLEKYKDLKTNIPKKGSTRESMTLQLLEGFKKKLFAMKEKAEEEQQADNVEEKKEEDDNESWLAHKLNFEGDAPVLAKDANLKNDDWFDITDPRNAINKRRREQSFPQRTTAVPQIISQPTRNLPSAVPDHLTSAHHAQRENLTYG